MAVAPSTALLSAAAVVGAVSLAVLAASAAAFVRQRADREGASASPAASDDQGAAPGGGERAGTAADGTSRAPANPETTAAADGATPSQEAVLLQEKLRAYREIAAAMIALNRAALELNQEEFREAADAIAFDQDSPLREPYLEVNEAYESHLYIIGDGVREATSEYVDYLATYRDDGAHAGGLFGRAGDVQEAMRQDVGLETMFEAEAAPPSHGSGDILPDPPDEEPDVEDFTEELGKPEDLEFFNGGDGDDGDGPDSAADSDPDDAVSG